MSESQCVKKKAVSKARIEYRIKKFVENGRREITKKSQLEKYPIGSLISYVNKSNIFKIGGFITKFTDEYFIYITPEFYTKYRVRYTNIEKMWAGNVYKTKSDIVSIVKSTQKKTKYSVTIGNITVHYANNAYFAGCYQTTKKYKRMVDWYKYFVENKI